jgi:hypothetical protein
VVGCWRAVTISEEGANYLKRVLRNRPWTLDFSVLGWDIVGMPDVVGICKLWRLEVLLEVLILILDKRLWWWWDNVHFKMKGERAIVFIVEEIGYVNQSFSDLYIAMIVGCHLLAWITFHSCPFSAVICVQEVNHKASKRKTKKTRMILCFSI